MHNPADDEGNEEEYSVLLSVRDYRHQTGDYNDDDGQCSDGQSTSEAECESRGNVWYFDHNLAWERGFLEYDSADSYPQLVTEKNKPVFSYKKVGDDARAHKFMLDRTKVSVQTCKVSLNDFVNGYTEGGWNCDAENLQEVEFRGEPDGVFNLRKRDIDDCEADSAECDYGDMEPLKLGRQMGKHTFAQVTIYSSFGYDETHCFRISQCEGGLEAFPCTDPEDGTLTTGCDWGKEPPSPEPTQKTSCTLKGNKNKKKNCDAIGFPCYWDGDNCGKKPDDGCVYDDDGGINTMEACTKKKGKLQKAGCLYTEKAAEEGQSPEAAGNYCFMPQTKCEKQNTKKCLKYSYVLDDGADPPNVRYCKVKSNMMCVDYPEFGGSSDCATLEKKQCKAFSKAGVCVFPKKKNSKPPKGSYEGKFDKMKCIDPNDADYVEWKNQPAPVNCKKLTKKAKKDDGASCTAPCKWTGKKCKS